MVERSETEMECRKLDITDALVLRFLLRQHTFAEIAVELGMTAPAVTQRMRKLERVFGCEITEAEGRRRLLTPHGQEIAVKADHLVAVLLDCVREMRGTPRPTRGRVRESWIDNVEVMTKGV